jgi:predicted type IV restriction endonuclease
MKDSIAAYVKRVRDLAEHVRGNEQATKQSLIGPLLTLLGYDLTDPRECVPEYRVDFGKDRSVKPIDWAFSQNGQPIFFVEAKEVGKRLPGYDEQLADYFAKAPEAKLGILTNGVQWRFFTDVVNMNVMDREPFLKWDVLSDEEPPHDFLTVLQKSQYNAELIRAFARRKRAQNLLVEELNRLLEPSPEFVRLAIANIETRKLTENVLETWKPVLANAINEWARQRALTTILNDPSASRRGAPEPQPSKIETTKEELDGFAVARALLGDARPVEYEDTSAYFKVHLPGRNSWVVCRFYFGRRRLSVTVPLPVERVQQLAPAFAVVLAEKGWAGVTLNVVSDLERLGEVLVAAYEHQRGLRTGGGPESPPDVEESQPGSEPSGEVVPTILRVAGDG